MRAAVLPFLSTTALINLKIKNYPWLSPPLTSQVSRDGLFEGHPLDAKFVRSEAFSDLTRSSLAAPWQARCDLPARFQGSITDISRLPTAF